MEIKIYYSKIMDLIYHVFAYLKIDNASDLYDINYIDDIDKIKKSIGFEYNIINQLDNVAEYYNKNFNKLCIIQFLPVGMFTLDEYINTLLDYKFFNSSDHDNFITPFIEILRNEYEFYSIHWDTLHHSIKVENQIINKFNQLDWLIDRDVDLYLSFSITKNGRGFYSDTKYIAAVPYPCYLNIKYDINHCYHMAFHEITHQITDRLISQDINMQDGSHDLSENIVIIADYYWLSDKTAYLNWLTSLMNKTETITETQLFDIFKIPAEIDTKLKTRLN